MLCVELHVELNAHVESGRKRYSPSSVAPAMLRCSACPSVQSRLLLLGGGVACRGSGAFRAERAQANHRCMSANTPEDTKAASRNNCTTIPRPIARHILMSSPLLDVWEAASGSPYYPAVGKNTQFTVGFVLLFLCTFP
jgi:hypothetical protein